MIFVNVINLLRFTNCTWLKKSKGGIKKKKNSADFTVNKRFR